MGYLGGKYKIRYEVAEYINSLSPKVYLEAFCGFAWVGERVRARRRILSDLNTDLILMWQALQKGWKPPTKISVDEYYALRDIKEHSALRGFAGTNCSFGGIFFGSYARLVKGDDSSGTAKQGARQMLTRIPAFVGAEFKLMDYATAIDSSNADVIYLDPPYENTSTYKELPDFDSKAFWNFVRERSDGKRRILVSEYSYPDDFTVVRDLQSRMGLKTKAKDGSGGLENDLRAEYVVEYQPPKGSRMVSFANLF